MKIVLIGGGSFVFAPTVLEDCIVKHRMEGELVLVDLNLEAAAAMAGAGRALARQHGVDLLVSETDNREEALPGADFVILSAAPQGALRWKMDFDILKQFGLDDQARECGGLGGMLGAFRSIAMAMELARDMERLCPAALLLDVTNPMPRVVTAVARFSSVGVAGFCNIAHRSGQGYGLLPGLIGRKPHEVDIVTGGLNHFAWVLSMKDKQSGADLLPELRSFVEHGDWSGLDEDLQRELDVMKRWLGQYGAVAAGAVDHHAEYLPVQPGIRYPQEPPYHGSAAERSLRLEELRAIAAGTLDAKDSGIFRHGSWEHPVGLALSLAAGSDGRLDILNVANGHAIQELPPERIVEVPVRVRGGKLEAEPLPELPPALAEVIRQLSDVHELVAQAAVAGDRKLAQKAVDLDPAIEDKETAYAALDRMLEAHADLLPAFA